MPSRDVSRALGMETLGCHCWLVQQCGRGYVSRGEKNSGGSPCTTGSSGSSTGLSSVNFRIDDHRHEMDVLRHVDECPQSKLMTPQGSRDRLTEHGPPSVVRQEGHSPITGECQFVKRARLVVMPHSLAMRSPRRHFSAAPPRFPADRRSNRPLTWPILPHFALLDKPAVAPARCGRARVGPTIPRRDSHPLIMATLPGRSGRGEVGGCCRHILQSFTRC